MTHKLSTTRLYSIYTDMKTRCFNPKNANYPRYGGRGITICNEWLNDNGLQNFIEWALSNGYNDNLTIDRINNDKGYFPNNCQWLTQPINSSKRNMNYEINSNSSTTVSEQIKILCIKLNISVSKLAELLGKSPQAFSQQMKRESLTVAELKKIAEVTNCKHESVFTLPNGDNVIY